jgi:hypothetical protein
MNLQHAIAMLSGNEETRRASIKMMEEFRRKRSNNAIYGAGSVHGVGGSSSQQLRDSRLMYVEDDDFGGGGGILDKCDPAPSAPRKDSNEE